MKVTLSWELHWIGTFYRLFWCQRCEYSIIVVSGLTMWCGLRNAWPVFIADNDP